MDEGKRCWLLLLCLGGEGEEYGGYIILGGNFDLDGVYRVVVSCFFGR